jgi:2-polyprenyl-6-methoxyphenol hydroxylase-like FAD-dependent oxidoreductase
MISIIGGGPVGLYTALNLSLSTNHYFWITVYEKRSEYTRQQTVLFQSIKIKLCELETQLKNECLKQKNIRFIEKEVLDLAEIEDQLVVIANGTKSKFRGEDLQQDRKHFLALTLKIKQTEPILPFSTSDLYCFLKLMEQPGFETEGSSITLILQLQDNNLEGKYNEENCPSCLLRYVYAYCRSKRVDCKNIEISCYGLSTQIAKKMVFRRQNKLCFLVGDAAVSLPFFRGVSFGFKSAKALVYCLVKNKIKNYQSQVEKWVQKETNQSLYIQKMLNLFSLYLFVSNHVSWQVVKWTEEEKNYILFGT